MYTVYTLLPIREGTEGSGCMGGGGGEGDGRRGREWMGGIVERPQQSRASHIHMT